MYLCFELKIIGFLCYVIVYKFFSDEWLLKLLKKSDQRAFDVIYERYWERLFAISYKRLKDLPECEDIVHDVFMSLWKNRESSDIQNLSAYLATAIKFKTISAIRARSRESIVIRLEDVHHVEAISTDINGEDAIHQQFLWEKVHHALQFLPPQCQLIFKFSRMEHLKNEEIAERLNISKRTVENQISRALKHLKPIFKE